MKKNNVTVYRSMLVRDTTVSYGDDVVSMSSTAARIFRETIKKRGQTDREQLLVMFLTNQNKVSGVNIVHSGTINSCVMSPREIMAVAITSNAQSIILCHNHPSGNCHPSEADLQTTRKMILSGEFIGVAVLDHIILGEDMFTSFKDEGLMNFDECSKKAKHILNTYMEL